MMAPPGIPGAATMVMPSIIMKWLNMPISNVMPCMIIRAMEHATSFSALPDMWTVDAQRHDKSGDILADAHFMLCRRVTGMVAADDDVPRAVK